MVHNNKGEFLGKKYKLPVNYTGLNNRQRKVVREQYIEEQDGKCYYCGTSLKLGPPPLIMDKDIDLRLFPAGFLNAPIHLQHNHATGMTEGAVHGRCNAVMWEYEGR
jgi:hypothetical protein